MLCFLKLKIDTKSNKKFVLIVDHLDVHPRPQINAQNERRQRGQIRRVLEVFETGKLLRCSLNLVFFYNKQLENFFSLILFTLKLSGRFERCYARCGSKSAYNGETKTVPTNVQNSRQKPVTVRHLSSHSSQNNHVSL